jgi:hypothetical protein
MIDLTKKRTLLLNLNVVWKPFWDEVLNLTTKSNGYLSLANENLTKSLIKKIAEFLHSVISTNDEISMQSGSSLELLEIPPILISSSPILM